MAKTPKSAVNPKAATKKKGGGRARGLVPALTGLMALTVMLGACASAPKAHLVNTSVGQHALTATDSRLRVLSSSTPSMFSTTGLVDPSAILCSEPSPDVATALATSFGAGASVAGRASAALSAQQVEGLVQLGERTAAIQLLRDKMYQTCLAYANGAITGTTYSLIMNRLDDAVVTLSLGDAAAGAFGRSLAGVGTSAAGSATAVSSDLAGELADSTDLATRIDEANANVDRATEDLQAHQARTPDDATAHAAEGERLARAVEDARQARDALVASMQGTLRRAAARSSASVSGLQAGGGVTARQDATPIREMQATFLAGDVGRDLISVCLVELGLRGERATRRLAGLEAVLQDQLTAETGRQDERGGWDRIDSATANVVGATLRGGATALTEFCSANLLDLAKAAMHNGHAFRLQRNELETQRALAHRGAITASQHASFMDAVRLCEATFTADADRKRRCLDAVIGSDAASGAEPAIPAASPTPAVHESDTRAERD